MTGPRLRTDILDAYVFRRTPHPTAGAELLQLRRARPTMAGGWHPVMGHIEPGETAARAMWRELAEETGLTQSLSPAAWALEQVHPFFLPDRDEIFLSPRFAVEAPPGWSPTLNHEHDAARWVPMAEAHTHFLWPGQLACVAEVARLILPPTAPGILTPPAASLAEALKIHPTPPR